MTFKEWLHHLLEPHCEECSNAKQCQSCEVLKAQLDIVNREKQRLLDALLERDKPATTTAVSSSSNKESDSKPLAKFVPWRVQKQFLEEKDRVTAKLMREKADEISKLEKELGINEQEVKNG